MRYESTINAIHRTPLVRLNNLSRLYQRNLYLKLESSNPGGSMKDRVALHCIEQAERSQELAPASTIIESTSGSLGVSLSLVGVHKGYRIICVVDPTIASANLALIRYYGAAVTMVDNPDNHGNYLDARLKRVKELLVKTKNSWWLNQYENPNNPEAHYLYTAPELYLDMEGLLDWIVCPVSTGGLVAGVARYFKERLPHCKIMAVDASGSVVLGGPPGPRKQLGIGSSRASRHIDFKNLDHCVYVNDAEAFACARLLAREEGLLLGCSTGSALAGLLKSITKTSAADKIAFIAADSGLKYLDTLYDTKGFEGVPFLSDAS